MERRSFKKSGAVIQNSGDRRIEHLLRRFYALSLLFSCLLYSALTGS
jgi:hypothetical protein